MYIVESYEKSKWYYLVTDDGLLATDEQKERLWSWYDIAKHFSPVNTQTSYPHHDWDVLTDEEMFLEQL